MEKRRSSWLDYLVYLAVRIVVCVVQAIPEPLAWRFADGLGWLAYRVNRRHRLVAGENLRRSFPHLNDDQVDYLVRRVYRHFCLMLIEIILMPRKYNRSNMDRYVKYPTPSDQQCGMDWFKSKRPLLTVSGHFGNWEMFSYVLGLTGFRGAVIARRLDNLYLDRFLKRFRIATGQQVLDKNKDYEKIRQTLAEGNHLGILGDQDAGPRGVFVDFFGYPASTHKAIALLALEYSAPIMVWGAARGNAPLYYDLYLADVILPEEYANQPDAIRRITERYTKAMEKLVRIDPVQYFWLHRRWKHQPPVRKAPARVAA